MKEVSEKEFRRVLSHCKRYTGSLQHVAHDRFRKYFHDGANNAVQLVYLCPICLKNKAAILSESEFRSDDEFTIDHFPPQSAGGKQGVLVCKACNNQAGRDYDYAIKEWLQEQAFVKGMPKSRFPVSIQFKGIPGKYRESLVSNGGSLNFNFDRFTRYTNVDGWFKSILEGKPSEQVLHIASTSLLTVYRALLKTAYLKAFSIWGYDFIYTDTGMKMRDVFTKNMPHILSNYGVFFHTNTESPPVGLCYTYMPAHLQSFMINFFIKDAETNYSCGISVLIPGPHKDDWQHLSHYQSIIDRQGSFTNGLIRLPEDLLTENNYFPYTQTWQSRHTIRIVGVNYPKSDA